MAAAVLNAPHVLRSFPRRWQHLTKALCDSSGGQCPDVWHCVPFLALHPGRTVLALGLLGAAGEASNLPQLNNGVQAAGLSLPAGELVRPPILYLQGPWPGHAMSPSSASPQHSFPGASSQPISVCTHSNASEPPGTEGTEEHQTEDTHISAKTHFGSENFSRRLTVPNIRLFLPLHHPCSVSQANVPVLSANTSPQWHNKLQVLAVAHSPEETQPETSGGQLLRTVQPWD